MTAMGTTITHKYSRFHFKCQNPKSWVTYKDQRFFFMRVEGSADVQQFQTR